MWRLVVLSPQKMVWHLLKNSIFHACHCWVSPIIFPRINPHSPRLPISPPANPFPPHQPINPPTRHCPYPPEHNTFFKVETRKGFRVLIYNLQNWGAKAISGSAFVASGARIEFRYSVEFMVEIVSSSQDAWVLNKFSQTESHYLTLLARGGSSRPNISNQLGDGACNSVDW